MKEVGSWNLTTPTLETVSTAALMAFTDQFFYRKEGWDYFYAPAYGEGITHTENSHFPRCELRQTLADGKDKQANWSPLADGSFVMYGECMVLRLPKSGKLVWSQWHGGSDHPPLKNDATLEKGKVNLKALLRKGYNSTEDKPIIYPDYVLGTPFKWLYHMKNGLLRMFIDGRQVSDPKNNLPAEGYQFDLDSYGKAKDKWYAKLGTYIQQEISSDDQSFGAGLTAHRNYGQYYTTEDVALPLPGQVELPLPEPVETPSAPATEPVAEPVSTTPAGPDGVLKRVQAIVDSNKAGKLAKKAAKEQLQAITDEVDAMPDSKEQTALYAPIKAAIKGLK